MKSFLLHLPLAILLLGSISFAQTTPNLEQGLKPYGSYHGGDIDSVSLTNGNLTLHIPLLSYSQRGKLSLDFLVKYNNKSWQVHQYFVGTTPHQNWQWRGQGVTVDWNGDWGFKPANITDTGLLVSPDTVTTPDDGSHQLGWVGSIENSIDATGLRFDGSTGLAYDRNGIAHNKNLIWDSNGNQITRGSHIDPNTQLNVDDGWTDTLGRHIPGGTYLGGSYGPSAWTPGNSTTDFSTCPSGTSSAYLWTVPAYGGNASFKFCYATITVSSNFGYSYITEASRTVNMMVGIVLPNGTRWSFSYNAQGDLSQITFPTGGTISYGWTTIGACDGDVTPVSRWVTSRAVDSGDGTGAHTWNYSYTANTTVTDPVGNDTVHVLTDLSGCSVYETETKYYQGNQSSGTLLKTVDTHYSYISNPLDGGNTAANVVADTVTTTWPNGKSSKTAKTYDNAGGAQFQAPSGGISYAFTYGGVVEQDDYDYGATSPLRKTVTNYYWQTGTNPNSSNYLSSNLLDLPASVTVKDGSNNRCAETDYAYDESSYFTSTSISTQHGAPPGPARGNASSVSKWLSNNALTGNTCNANAAGTTIATHTNWYDTGGPFKTYDAAGNATTYSYSPDFAGAYVTQTQMPDTSSPGLAHHSVSGYYDFNTGLITSFTDQNGQQTTYGYDNMWRIISAVFPDAISSTHGETDFFYPDANTVERKQRIDGSRWTDLFVQFDGLGRESRRRSFNDNPSNQWDQIDTCYDGNGRQLFVSYPYQSTGFGTPKRCSNAAGPGDTYAYDAVGRIRTVTHSDNTVVNTDYGVNGNAATFGAAVSVTDEGNNSYRVQRISQSDALGRLTSVCEVSNGSLQGSNGTPAACGQDIPANGFLTTYGYDLLGNLTSVNQGSVNRSFTYDSLSRLLTASNPESGTTSYTYDSDATCSAPNSSIGDLIKKVDARGIRTCMRYDALHRLTQKNYSDATPTASFNYDESSIATTSPATSLANTIGRMSSTKAGSTGSLVSYDPMGRVVGDWQCTPRTCPGNTYYNLAYQYDLLGDPTSATNGAGVTFTNSYNQAARLTQMTSNASQGPATLLSQVRYGPFGMAQALFGNNWGETRGYHQRGWQQSQQDGPSSVAAAVPSTGSVTIGGSLNSYQQLVQQATAGTGSVDIQGVEPDGVHDMNDCEYIGSTLHCYGPLYYDEGPITIWVNGNPPETVNYGYGSNGTNLASAMVGTINSDPNAPVTAWSSGEVVYLTAKWAGAWTNFSLSASSSSTSPYFGSASFTPYPSGSSLTGGSDAVYTTIYDSGTTSVTVNNGASSHTTTYGSWSGSATTPASIASGLCGAINNDAGAYVYASTISTADASHQCPVNTATVFLMSRSTGAVTNSYTFSAASSSSQNSFPTSVSNGGQLSGGDDSHVAVNSVQYSFSLGFAPDGNITSGNDQVNGNWTYTYDQFNRLLTSNKNSGAQAFSYDYDRYGNRLHQNVTAGSGPQPSYSFTGNNNRVDGYSYDAAGNLLNDGTHTYTYDAENRVISVDGTINYVYDAEGRRIAKKNGSTITAEYLLSLGGTTLVELSGSGGTVRQEIYAGAQHLGTYSGTTTYFTHTDWLGNERARSNMSSALCQTSVSLPFGDGMSNPVNTCSPTPDFMTGKQRDTETGVDYFGARFYLSQMGKWMTPDWSAAQTAVPYGDLSSPQSLNLYAYVKNNPISARDSDGHCPDGVCENIATLSEDEVVQRGQGFADEVVGAAKGLWNLVAGAWNTGADLLNTQGQASGQPQMEVQTVPTAEFTNPTQAVSGALTQTAVILSGAPESRPAVPEEIPAGPSPRPTATQQESINQMGEAHGCHTCGARNPGTKSGNWVGDHQPSTALNPPGGKQVYKPQCLQCSRRQGGQVAAATRAAKKKGQPQEQ